MLQFSFLPSGFCKQVVNFCLVKLEETNGVFQGIWREATFKQERLARSNMALLQSPDFIIWYVEKLSKHSYLAFCLICRIYIVVDNYFSSTYVS